MDEGNKAYKRSIESNSPKVNTKGGKVYKEDFAKDGNTAPADWGDCCKGGKPMGVRAGY